MPLFPTASGLERGSKSANRLNHTERSLDGPPVSEKEVRNQELLNINSYQNEKRGNICSLFKQVGQLRTNSCLQ